MPIENSVHEYDQNSKVVILHRLFRDLTNQTNSKHKKYYVAVAVSRSLALTIYQKLECF